MCIVLLVVWGLGMVYMVASQYCDQSFDGMSDRLIGLALCAAWPPIVLLVVLSYFNIIRTPGSKP